MLWTVSVEGGPRRVNHAAVGVPEKKLVFSFGGYCTGDHYNLIKKMDIHVFNATTLQWFKLKTPTKENIDYHFVPYMRYGHTACLIGNIVYIFGGRNDTYGACNRIFCFNTDTLKWSVPGVKGTIPEERDGHSACVIGTKMYIFGGFKEFDERFSSDLFYLETETMTWYRVANQTPDIWRDFHTSTAIGKKLYVFGGRGDQLGPIHTSDELYDNTVYEFDTEKVKWSKIAVTGISPIGRRSHSALSYKNNLYIFGGYNGKLNKHFSDMWKFNPEQASWKRLDIPGNKPFARRRQSWSLIGDEAVLFGGTCPISNERSVQSRGTHDDQLLDLQDLSDVHIFDFSPNLKTLCKRAVLAYDIECKNLPIELRMELESMKPGSQTCRSIPAMTQG